METTSYDVIIVGSGPAGLSAAHMLGRARRRVLVIDSGEPRNRYAHRMHGVLGMDGLPPARLREIGHKELEPYDVDFLDASVAAVWADDDTVTASVTDPAAPDRTFTGRALVVATGASDGLPDIPGLAEHWGTRVLHCPYCHGWEVRGQRLAVIATTTMSPYQAQLIRQWSDHLTAFTAAGPLDEQARRRILARGTAINTAPVTSVALADDGSLLVHTDDGTTTEVDAIFLGTTLRPRDEFLPADLARTRSDHGSFLATDDAGRTSHRRIWATGNVTSIYANVPMAMGAGSALGGALNADLLNEDTQAAVDGF